MSLPKRRFSRRCYHLFGYCCLLLGISCSNPEKPDFVTGFTLISVNPSHLTVAPEEIIQVRVNLHLIESPKISENTNNKQIQLTSSKNRWKGYFEWKAPTKVGDYLINVSGEGNNATAQGYALVHVANTGKCKPEEVREAGECTAANQGHHLQLKYIQEFVDPSDPSSNGSHHPRAVKIGSEQWLAACLTSVVAVSQTNKVASIEALRSGAIKPGNQTNPWRETAMSESGIPQCEGLHLTADNLYAITTSVGAENKQGGLASWKLSDNGESAPIFSSAQKSDGVSDAVIVENTVYAAQPRGSVAILALSQSGTFSEPQRLNLKETGSPGPISHANEHLLVGVYQSKPNQNAGKLLVLSINKDSLPTVVGSIETSGVVNDIEPLSENIVALAAGARGIDLIEVSNPTKPILLTTHQTTRPTLSLAYDEGYLLSSLWDSVQLYDASNPSNLRLLDWTDGVVMTPNDVEDPHFRGFSVASHVDLHAGTFTISEINVAMMGKINPGHSAPRMVLHDRVRVVSNQNANVMIPVGITVSNGGRKPLTVSIIPNQNVQPNQEVQVLAPGETTLLELSAKPPGAKAAANRHYPHLPTTWIDLISNDPQTPMRLFGLAARTGNFNLGDKAPLFKVPVVNECGNLECALEQRCLDSSQLQNKPTVIAFYSSWCPTCGEEIPDLMQLLNAEFGEEVTLFAAQWGESPEAVLDFIGDTGLTVPIIVDNPMFKADCWSIPMGENSLHQVFHQRIGNPDEADLFPLQIVISPDGTLAWLSHDHKPAELLNVLHSLLN